MISAAFVCKNERMDGGSPPSSGMVAGSGFVGAVEVTGCALGAPAAVGPTAASGVEDAPPARTGEDARFDVADVAMSKPFSVEIGVAMGPYMDESAGLAAMILSRKGDRETVDGKKTLAQYSAAAL